MDDDPNVTPEPVSTEEPVSPEVTPEVTPEPKPFSEEQETRIAELLKKATEVGEEQGSRKMQGKKDREVAEAQRRAKFFEERLETTKGRYADLEPEVRERLENEDLRTQLKQYQTKDQEDAARAQQMAAAQQIQQGIEEHLKSLGIDLKDERLDWASDTPDYVTARRRFDASVAKILGEVKVKDKKDMEDKFSEMEKKLRKDLGLESVETNTPVASDDDVAFLEKWNSGTVKSTKANLDRVNKILNKE